MTDVDARERYESAIELSNACREFYKRRESQFRVIKKAVKHGETPVPKTSLECKMLQLKNEMSSLMDLDLSLMKQLLTLNESIEDLKENPIYGSEGSLGSCCSESSESLWPNQGSDDEADDDDIDADDICQKSSSAVEQYPDEVFETEKEGLHRFVTGSPTCDYPIPKRRLSKTDSGISVCSEGEDSYITFDFDNTNQQQTRNDNTVFATIPRQNKPNTLKTVTINPTAIEFVPRVPTSKPKKPTSIIKASGTQVQTDITDFNTKDITRNNPLRKNLPIKIHHKKQGSFDSGIHEPEFDELKEIMV
ncbi:unnamed protein product [Owenia fusiformis]|uniref:Uncharacterized protein n=1 Tax=Owenia fusiformis TaxID=6347 RepID=A0A8J1XRA4_OWEFU|nr:unnamed protein product [Owenia fusiformis]